MPGAEADIRSTVGSKGKHGPISSLRHSFTKLCYVCISLNGLNEALWWFVLDVMFGVMVVMAWVLSVKHT